MIQVSPLSFKVAVPKKVALGLYLVYALVVLGSLHAYIKWQSVNVVLGMLALPLVAVIQQGNCKRIRYGTAAALFALLTILLPHKTFLYFTIAFACFFVTENCIGKINWLPVGVVCLMSPVAQSAVNVFSIPIRLQLTKWAGAFMNWVQGDITVNGNMLISKNSEFSVDPACMGLNMMVTSLLLQLIIIAMYQRKYNLQLAWLHLTGLLAISFALNIVSNLFRIICLVWFTILSGTAMHDLAGLFCLLVYVIIPMVWLTQLAIKHKGQPASGVQEDTIPVLWTRVLRIHLVMFLIISWAAYRTVLRDRSMADATAPVAIVRGYKAERITAGIVKLQNRQSLIYVKNIPGFFSADHHPMICWKGSGYSFGHMQLETIGGQQVYTALLQNGNERLYTGWWYDNGSDRTVEQVNWRSKMLMGGRPFSVVNVTAVDKQHLVSEIEDVIRGNRLKPLL